MGINPTSEHRPIWQTLIFVLPVSAFAVLFIAVGAAWLIEEPELRLVLHTPKPSATPTSTATPWPTFTPTLWPPTQTSTPTPPTPTNTRVIPLQVYEAARLQTVEPKSDEVAALHIPIQSGPLFAARPASAGFDSRLVLAHYFAWFDGNGWDDCNISAGDKPLEPYHSDDPAAIARHVRIAREIGLNGFTLHWFAPGDRTDQNFRTLLAQSQGTDFTSTIVFSHHIWHGRPHDTPTALRYITAQYAIHPNFLHLAGKPVIFFTDVYRTPRTGGLSPQQYWAAVRAQVDPQRQSWWIAEGLDASYLDVFDGLYVFKISHAAYPHDYQKSPGWGASVRSQARQMGRPKLWIATIGPGWDDLRSGCKPDVRINNTSHRLARANGATYEATFSAALDSKPDWLIVGSFNEWVEGTYIEPSVQYGDTYMRITQEFIRRFQGH